MRKSVQISEARKQYIKNRVGSVENFQPNRINTLQSQSTNEN